MLDADGYRPNVGIVICNAHGQVLWAKRFGQNSWQFPQGGIQEGETPEQAMYRELYEEVGLRASDVKILHASKYWLRYKLPRRFLRPECKPLCIGQKQRWFLLQLISPESHINMHTNSTPEFDGWRWVSFWYPVRQVIAFKRDVYRRAMKEFSYPLWELNRQAPRYTHTIHTENTANNFAKIPASTISDETPAKATENPEKRADVLRNKRAKKKAKARKKHKKRTKK